MDGYPKSLDDSSSIFMDKIPIAKEGEEEGAEEE